MRTTRLVLTAVVAVGLAAPARAQVAWDAPLMVSPGTTAGWGIYLVDSWPGDGFGVLGTWRRQGRPGFRIGVAEGRDDDLAGFGGVDVSGGLFDPSEDFPMDAVWLVGAGLGLGDAVLLSFPLGLSFGRVVDVQDVRLHPYFAPRVVVDAWLGDDTPEDETEHSQVLEGPALHPLREHSPEDLDDSGTRCVVCRGVQRRLDLQLALDVGLDISLSPSWSVRFSGTLGDREAIAIGLSVQ